MFDSFAEYYSNVDWSYTAKAVRDFTVAAASAIGAVVATLGLRTWRAQLRGNTQYDLARRLLKSSLQVRDAIRVVRNPFMSSGEISDAVRTQYPNGEHEKLPGFDAGGAVYTARWNAIADAMTNFKLEAIEAEVIWGPEVPKHLAPLRKCVVDLRLAVMRHLQRRAKPPIPLKPEEVEKIERTVFELSEDPEDDPFTKQVHDAIEAVQTYVAPHLKL